jgi:cell division septation protein DedD
MSKAKDDEAPESDELFDRDLLSDSDSEFLAELDRVLTPENALGPEHQRSAPPATFDPAAEPQSTDLLTSDLEGDPFADNSQAAALEPAPAVLEEELPPGLATALEETEGPNRPESELFPPAGERMSAESTPAAPREPDWDSIPERIAERRHPVDANPAMLYRSPFDEESAPLEEAPEPALAQDDAAGEGEATGEPATPFPTGAVEAVEEDMGEPRDRQEPDVPIIPASPPPASPPPESSAQAVDSPPTAGAGAPASSLWNGLLALLAILGLGAGGGALWQGAAVDQRLTELESLAPAAPGTPARPAQDNGYAELSTQIEGLTRENRELRNELAKLRDEMQQRLNTQERQFAGTLQEIQSGLGGLGDKLRDLRPAQAATPAPAVEAEPPRAIAAADAPAPAEETLPEPPRSKATKAPTGEAQTPPVKRGWVVNLLSLPNRSKAESALERLKGIDLPVSIVPADVKGNTWYRLQVGGFATQAKAQAFAKSVRAKSGLSATWVGRE